MKFKLAKKYSLVLTFVMVFSFFVPTIVSANYHEKSYIDIIEDYGWGEILNSKVCGDSALKETKINSQEQVGQKKNDSNSKVCGDLALKQTKIDSQEQVGQKNSARAYQHSDIDSYIWKRNLNSRIRDNSVLGNMKLYAILDKNETDSNNSNDDENITDDEDTTDDENDDEYNNKDAKNVDNNKKMSNENIDKMDINKDLNEQRHKEDESNAYDEENFSKEDLYRRDHVIKFSLNLSDDTYIYDQQIVKTGDVTKQIADPERDGYTFGGWYYDKDCSEKPYNFNDPVLRNFTVYAKWIKNEQIFKMKISKNLIPSIENNDITKLFQINRNVSSPPVKPRNSIARFRRLENAKPKNINNISRFLSENIDIFNNGKGKKDVKIKDKRPFSNDLYLHNPKTGDIGIIIWIGFMSVSALGTSDVVKLLKKEK